MSNPNEAEIGQFAADFKDVSAGLSSSPFNVLNDLDPGIEVPVSADVDSAVDDLPLGVSQGTDTAPPATDLDRILADTSTAPTAFTAYETQTQDRPMTVTNVQSDGAVSGLDRSVDATTEVKDVFGGPVDGGIAAHPDYQTPVNDTSLQQGGAVSGSDRSVDATTEVKDVFGGPVDGGIAAHPDYQTPVNDTSLQQRDVARESEFPLQSDSAGSGPERFEDATTETPITGSG